VGVTPQGDGGGNCGITWMSPNRVAPNVLIVLDRSMSMNDQVVPINDLGGLLACLLVGPCPSKWAEMTKAINASVMASQANVNWGIKFFPNDSGCTVNDGPAVPVAPNNAAAVNTAIAGVQPGGATPTTSALQSAARYLTGLTTPNPRYVVLATDGQPNCGGGGSGNGDDTGAIAAVSSLAAAGIPVFVIGVATDGSAADATLSSMATAGQKPRAATPPYYPVATSVELTAALSAIGGQVISCTFAIPLPPVPDHIAVVADGARIPRDAATGWEYGPGMTSIDLHGTWCTNLQNGTIQNVEVAFGCQDIVP
jgi:hypothetical protein